MNDLLRSASLSFGLLVVWSCSDQAKAPPSTQETNGVSGTGPGAQLSGSPASAGSTGGAGLAGGGGASPSVGSGSGGGGSPSSAAGEAGTQSSSNAGATSSQEIPASILGGLDSWHLTLPTGPSEKATQINQPELATYSDAYFEPTVDGRGVRMVALFGGSRTSTGTAFARSELRQDYAGPAALAGKSWACAASKHAMHIKQRVVQSPLHKPEMSIGQIHDAQNDLLEVTYVGPEDANSIGTGDGLSDLGVVEAHFNNDTSVEALDAAYHLDDSMQVDISTDGAGNMNLSYRNDTTGASKSVTQKFYGSVSGGCYFKAGNYHQACTKLDINAAINASCAAKSWPAGRWETDANGTSVLELYELSAD